ncbi:MAG: hypothetical protein AB1898_29380 [Acidobacteriota bacterium]
MLPSTRVQKIAFKGWPNCYRVSNGTIELVATADIGPRIIFFGFSGERNLFHVFEETAGETAAEGWRNYGGHRLWHAPEDKMRTYEPDNGPVEVMEVEDGLLLKAGTEKRSGIQKVIEIVLPPGGTSVRVLHRLRNHNLWPVELAPWALSVMAPGGIAIAPLTRRHDPDLLLPNRGIVLWPYTDMRDERYQWNKDFVLVRQKAMGDLARTKVGLSSEEGWAAYSLASLLFVKYFRFVPGANYPDLGCSLEVFTNSKMLELETLGPLQLLRSGQELSHVEYWELHKNVPVEFSEESIRTWVLPRLRKGGVE